MVLYETTFNSAPPSILLFILFNASTDVSVYLLNSTPPDPDYLHQDKMKASQHMSSMNRQPIITAIDNNINNTELYLE